MVELTVSDGVAVNAFDIKLTYEKDRLALQSWAHGGYLSALSCVNEIKSPGLLELDCTQLGQDPVSGDGVLLELIFETKALGTSPITLEEAVFADSQGLQTQPQRVNGVVNIQNLPAWTPTYTLTPTPTLTQTATITFTPTQPPPSPTPRRITGTPTLASSPTAAPDLNTPTVEGPPTKTLATPISGVAGPASRHSPTSSDVSAVETALATSTQQEQEAHTPTPSDSAQGEVIDAAHTPEGGQKISPVVRNQAMWNTILLVLLIASLGALGIMIVLIIRRRQQKDEDLLL